jgi:phosphonate transport system substrate-binding protein
MPDLLVFGYAASVDSPTDRERMAQFCRMIGEIAGLGIAVHEAGSYDEVALLMHRGALDFAWLPPIPYIALERSGACAAVVSHHRGGAVTYDGVLVVRADSGIDDVRHLEGARAAWVDARSASGYVLPRIELFARGVDPRTAFPSEAFYRSHEAAVRAVAQGRADFAATYAGADASGALVRAAWLGYDELESALRVLVTLGAIPGDVIAAKMDMPEATLDRVTRALIASSRDKGNHLLIRDVFGVDEFRRFVPAGYESLRRATEQAAEQGLLEGVEHGEEVDETAENEVSR